jgi:peptide-methionine (R)-S-oxide reductase
MQNKEKGKKYQVVRTEEEWKQLLSPEQYRILRKKHTESPFSGAYNDMFAPGTYVCAGCGQLLFNSESKFNSGCGWPAFDREASAGSIEYENDSSFGMRRTEILCSNCGGHLGHLFDDGPTETGMRFCVNSASLSFTPNQ